MSKNKKAGKKKGAGAHVGKLPSALRLSAIEVKQSQHTMYVFKAKASVLFSAFSINQKIEDKDEGYQRVLSLSRVQAITQFVKAKRPIPGAIIVSLKAGATFSKPKREIYIPAGENVGWIIDGQHRLAGAAMAAREGVDVEVPVVAFFDLTPAMQIDQFVTINREAKNVPTSLYLDLLKQMPHKKPADFAKERSADLATQLRKDEESPFFERIVITSPPKSGQTISLTNFVRKISIHVAPDKGILNAYTEKEQLGVVANYYQGLRQVFSKDFESKDSMFFKTIGFGALWNVFPTFFSLTLKNQSGFTVKDVALMFKRIATFDFASLNQYGSGDQAERNAGEELKATLLLAFNSETDPTAGLKLVED